MPDIWELHDADEHAYAVITTNNTLRHGAGDKLVNIMGGGLALDAARREPSLPRWYAKQILEGHNAACFDGEKNRLLLVPTKLRIENNSTLREIEAACDWLRAWGIWHPDEKILVPRLGCGLGGLDYEDVYPLLSWLRAGLPEGQAVLV